MGEREEEESLGGDEGRYSPPMASNQRYDMLISSVFVFCSSMVAQSVTPDWRI